MDAVSQINVNVMTIKTIVIKYLIVALLAFALGTFFPNPVAKKKTENATIAWAKSLGFGPPRFEYHNNQELFMLIEYQAKTIEKHSKQLEENVHTKVLISQLEKKVDKLEKELDTVRGK